MLAFMYQVWAHPRFEALKLLEAADGAANASKTGARTLEPRQHFACAKPVPSECVWRDLTDARAFSCWQAGVHRELRNEKLLHARGESKGLPSTAVRPVDRIRTLLHERARMLPC